MSRFLLMFMSIHHLASASLLPRGPQSNATCSNDFQWAENSKGLFPCVVAAYVDAACGSGDWLVPQLQGGEHYSVPSATANPCTCSWASYNLLSACTACQGLADDSIQNWAAFRTNCSSYLSTDLYFPTNTPIQGGMTIPFWAGTDPTTWQDGQFAVTAAEQIAAEGKPDLDPSSKSPEKGKTSVGPIVGGVVGGVVVLLIGVIAAFILIRRRKRLQLPVSGDISSRPGIHGRSISDFSHKSATTAAVYGAQHQGLSYTGTNVTPPPPTSPTIHTHSSSVHSLSYFGTAQHSTFSAPSIQSRQLSPPPVPQTNNQPIPREDMIRPFLLTQGSQPAAPFSGEAAANVISRKGVSESPGNPGYDASSPPVSRVEETLTTPARPRFNPPAYSPYAAGPGSEQDSSLDLSPSQLAAARREQQGHGHRLRRGAKGSQDTLQSSSWDSSGGRTTSAGGAHDQSITGMSEVVGRMGLSIPQNVSGKGGSTMLTGQSGQQVSPPPRVVQTNPTGAPNGDDIPIA